MTDANAQARLAGAFYLVIFFTASFSELFVRTKMVVLNDPAATANNIAAHETLYRFGLAAAIITLLCDTAVGLLFYELFKPVSRTLSLAAAVFRFIFVAMMAANSFHYFAPLIVIRTPSSPLAYVFERVYSAGFTISNIFFACHCILIGYLIFRSSFLPRLLGVFALSGLFYMTLSFARIVAPHIASVLSPWLLLPAGLIELTLTLWLLIAGVKEVA